MSTSTKSSKYVKIYTEENNIEYIHNLFEPQIIYARANPRAFEDPTFVSDCKKVFNPSFKIPSLIPAIKGETKYQRKNCSVTANGAFFNWVITDHNKSLQLYFNTSDELCRSGLKPTADNVAGCEKFRGLKDFKPRPLYKAISLSFSEFIRGGAKSIPDAPEGTEYENTRIIEKDSATSLLFEVLYIMTGVIEHEWNFSIQNGIIFLDFVLEKKKENASISAKEVLELYNQEYPTIHALAQIIIDDKERSRLIKSYKKEGVDVLLDGILVVAVKDLTKCVSNNTIGDEEKPLAMRYFTAKIPHQSDGFFDKEVVKISNFNESFKQNRLDNPILYNTFDSNGDNFITANNIDSIITPKSVISGKFYLKCSSHPKGFSVSLITEEFMVANSDPVEKKKTVAVRIPSSMMMAMNAAAINDAASCDDIDDDASLDIDDLQADLNSVFDAFGIQSDAAAGVVTNDETGVVAKDAAVVAKDAAVVDNDAAVVDSDTAVVDSDAGNK